MATRRTAFGQMQRAMREQEFAVGISFLELLAQQPLPPTTRTDLVLLVPENLVRLVRRAPRSDHHRIFLLRMMRAFVSPAMAGDVASPNRITNQHVDILIGNVESLLESGRMRVIEEVDPSLEQRLEEIFPRSQFGIAMSPEQNFVARYLGAVFSWSKKTGKAILEGGERLVNHVGSMIASLRIPDRITTLRKEKQKLSTELLATIGISENVKWFVVIAIAAATPFIPVALPLATAIGVIGFWLAVTDP